MGADSADSALAIDDGDLLAVESQMLDAFAKRSLDGLNVLGFGELGVPLAWPDDNPRLCVKRLVSSPHKAEIEGLFENIEIYIDAIAKHVEVVPTELRMVENEHGRSVGYLVQPRLPSAHLLENVLAETTPEVDHPAIVAIAEAVQGIVADQRVTIDSQVSNFTWHDGALAFFDIGTPFMLDGEGSAVPLQPVLFRTMPAPLRSVGTKQARAIADEFADLRGNLEHAVLGAGRLGRNEWIEPMVDTFNPLLDEPLIATEIRSTLAQRHSDMVKLKNLMKLQRAWVTKVRRKPFDYFITDSFTGEIL